MSKFKVGDKVVRKPRKDNSSFKTYQGDFAYYVITDITTSGHWLQLDNFTDGGERMPTRGTQTTLSCIKRRVTSCHRSRTRWPT
ncbi:hypothetical protein phiKpS2_10 [Klebsiella phage phiKpS2]|uniref:Uncharacterized protein n=1 Tax=Klebsiella phage phiKpS2 TaxID=1897515 RepID=A0A2S1ZEM2_9CAUD|nr:hypothetical protein HOS10_gp10 [Klebsiella phage phiKpS2]AWK24004.1 hypothetical protein phiKpS2_10 [Klebsiella phage phiKpS2]